MSQIIILLYFTALISAALVFSRFTIEYRRTRDPALGSFLRYTCAYTLMVGGVGFLTYIRVNLSSSLDLLQLSVSLILASAGWVALEHSLWNFTSRRLIRPKGIRVLSFSSVIAGTLSGLTILIFPNTALGTAAIGITMALFGLTIVLTMIISLKHDRRVEDYVSLKIWRRAMRPFALFCLLVIVLEFGLFRAYTIEHGWFISLPLVYMLWNILVLVMNFHPGVRLSNDAFQNALKSFGLTPKEIEVTGRIAEGRTNHEIAYALGITKSTVKNHITSIYRKTGVSGRINLVNLIRSTIRSIQDPLRPPENQLS